MIDSSFQTTYVNDQQSINLYVASIDAPSAFHPMQYQDPGHYRYKIALEPSISVSIISTAIQRQSDNHSHIIRH